MTENYLAEHGNLQVDGTGKTFFAEIAKWAKLLAIMGFIGMGIMVLAGIVMCLFASHLPAIYAGVPGIMMGMMYFVIAIIYYFPISYLYNFAKTCQLALRDNNQAALTTALGYLKSHYKFLGIMTIIVLSLYGIAIIFGIIGALATIGHTH